MQPLTYCLLNDKTNPLDLFCRSFGSGFPLHSFLRQKRMINYTAYLGKFLFLGACRTSAASTTKVANVPRATSIPRWHRFGACAKERATTLTINSKYFLKTVVIS